jgi:hypothetical protein
MDSLEKRLEKLEKEIQRLSDFQEIANLQRIDV